MNEILLKENFEELKKVDLKDTIFNGEMKDNALHLAFYHNLSEEMVDFLIEKGVDINGKNCNGMTPVAYGIQQKNFNLVNKYVDKSQINIIDDLGRNQLIMSVIYGSIELIKLLIKIGANVAATGISGSGPLHFAIIHNRKDILDGLLKEKKFDIDAKDNEGNTPLMLSIKNKNKMCVECLLKKKKIKLMEPDKQGDTILHILSSQGDESIDILSSIISKSSNLLKKCTLNVDVQNEEGNTPLMCAIKSKNSIFTLKKLVNLKANSKIANKKGETALTLAKAINIPNADILF